MDQARVKKLRCKLSFHLAVIACLTAMLVATGTGTLFLPAFIFCVCLIAYIGVDRMEWFELGQISAAFGMVAATGTAVICWVYSTIYKSESGQLLAVAGLLVYPEAVLFLQRKNLRIFEQLAVFLLLEMVVAALVNDNLLFAILLAPIMLMWVSSLFLFSRYATLVRIDPTIETPTPHLAELLFRKFVKSVLGESKPEAASHQFVPSNEVQRSRWSRRLLQSFPIGFGAVVFAALFFYLVPRSNPTSLSGFKPTSATGLPDDLSFGQFGKILQNQTALMRVTFYDGDSQEPFCPIDPPYLRAKIFDRYGPENGTRFNQGKWVFRGHGESSSWEALKRPDNPREVTKFGRDHVDVEFDIKPQFSKNLYAVPPMFNMEEKQKVELRYEPVFMVFQNLDQIRAREKAAIYRVKSAGFLGGGQSPVTPAVFLRKKDRSSRYSSLAEADRGLRLSNRANERYANTSAYLKRGFSTFDYADEYRTKLISQLRLDPAKKVKLAKGLEEHLAFSGSFSYSLNLSPPSDADMDAVEDFLVNQRAGHCQYFASALACLLRQSDIPCRLVIGYRPTEFNKIGEYFTVRQRDAHAWVEALLQRSDLEGTKFEKYLTDADYYWLRLDPTPPPDGELAITEQSGQAIDYAEKLWKDYVIDGQKLATSNSIYEPVSESKTTFASMIEKSKQLITDLRSGRINLSVDFAWRVFFGILVIGVGMVGVGYLLGQLPKFAPNWANKLGLIHSPLELTHPFYARCLSLVARLGLRRKMSETPQEYTAEAATVLDQKGQDDEGSLEFLTSLYYQLRFGKKENAPDSVDPKVNQNLNTLEKAVQRGKRAKP